MNEFIDNLLDELEDRLTAIDEKYPTLLEGAGSPSSIYNKPYSI